MDFEILTLGDGENRLLVTVFGDGAYLIEDGEGAQILISKDQIKELIEKIGGEL